MKTEDFKISEEEAKSRCRNRVKEQNLLFPAHPVNVGQYVKENWKIVAKLGILRKYSGALP